MLRDRIQRFKSLLLGERLRAQTIRGGTWLGAGTITAQLFRLGRNVLLARLLSPASFGAMAIIISISSMMDTFTEIGIREAIIQHPNGNRRDYLSSGWWLSVARSVVSYAVVFAIAPAIADFYHDGTLTGLGRVALLSVIFRGLMSPGVFTSLKQMDFKRWTVLQYGSGIAGSVLTVLLAIQIRSVWALAIGFAAEYVLLCVGSFVLFPFMPAFRIQREAMRDLLNFSKGVFGLSFLNLIYVRADIFVLGRLIPAAQLGIYTMAIYLAQAASTFALNYQGQLLLPLFAQLQGDAERTNQILAKGASLLAALLMPALTFILLSGRALLGLLYGAPYATAFWPLVLAVTSAFFNVANAQLTTVFYAYGKPQLHRFCLLIMAGMIAITIYPAARYFGTAGAQAAVLLTMLTGYAIQIGQIRRLTGFRLAFQTKRMALNLLVPACVLAVAVAIKESIQISDPIQNLAFGTAAALVAVTCVAFISIHHIGGRLRAAA